MNSKLNHLQEILRQMKSVAVAYSGGIDSTFLLKVAYDCLGDRAVGVTVVSPSVPRSELEEARTVAEWIGVRHVLLPGHEMEDPRYTANTENRCYFCKTDAFEEILHFARKERLDFVVDGTNAGDVGDHRPGLLAAKEKGVRSPLQEADIHKEEIRRMAKQLGLPNWDKPAAACLSSRIPYGSSVTVQKLSQIEHAEAFLKKLGLRQVRVRHHDQVARIEVEINAFSTVLEHHKQIVQTLKTLGFQYITLDLSGFRSGSMNEVLHQNG